MSDSPKSFRLEEISEIRNGSTPSTSNAKYWDDGTINWLTPDDLSKSHKYTNNTRRKITGEGLKSINGKLAPAGSIVLSTRAPIGYVTILEQEAVTNQGCKTLIPNKALVTSEYLYYLLIQYKNELVKHGAGSTFAEISLSSLKKIEVPLPKLAEQQKISKLIGDVDEAITLTQASIDNTETLKVGLTHQYFNEKGWSKKPLSDLIELVIDHRGKTPKKMGSEWAAEGIPAISAMNVKNNKLVKPETFKYVDHELYKKWMKVELKGGDMLLTSEAPMGEMYLVKEGERYCLSQRLFGLRLKQQYVLPDFFYYFLSSRDGKKELTRRLSGSTAKGIRQSELMKIEVPVPKASEQSVIIKTLSILDKKIDMDKELKYEQIRLKQGLLKDLLVGDGEV